MRACFGATSPLLLGGLILLSGCGRAGGDAARWTGSVDTLSNGALLVRNPAAPLWDSATAWRPERLARIGRIEGAGPDLLGDARMAELDPLGRVWVLDNQAKELRVFDAAGAHVRTIGRDGEGPGEFRNPTGMAWDRAGRLWVMDPRLDRYSLFDTMGTLLRTHRRPIGSWGYVWDGRFGEDGRLYEQTSRIVGVDPTTRETRRERVLVALRFEGDADAVPDTFRLPQPPADAEPPFFVVEYPAGSPILNSVRAIPYMPGHALAFDPAGFVWSGFGAEYRLVKQTLAGDTVLVIEREHAPEPVTADERGRALEGLLGDLGPGAQYEDPRIPQTKPAFDQLLVDDLGHLWVRVASSRDAPEGTASRSTYDVFDPAGRYLGRVDTPYHPHKPPVIRGDRMAGIATDELGVNYAVLLRLDGRPLPPREAEVAAR